MSATSTRQLLTLALLTATLWGCSGDPAPQCQFNGDCIARREACDVGAGVCVVLNVAECAKDEDCPTGRACALPQGICGVPIGMMDTPTDLPPADMTPDVPISHPDAPPDVPLDMPAAGVPPRLVGALPAPNEAPLEATPTFELRFDQPLDPISVSAFTIFLWETRSLGSAMPVQIALEVSYDPNSSIARVTPAAPLAPATAYTLEVSTFLRSTARVDLDRVYQLAYITPSPTNARHLALAERWAPVIYQGLSAEAPALDLPTIVALDGDFNVTNNLTTATSPGYDPRAAVYYHVTESQTHTFLWYVLYYPRREITSSSTGQPESYPHDLTGVMLVVEKATDALVIVEGVRVEPGTDLLISYTREGTPYRAVQSEPYRQRFDADALEQGRRYQLYVPARRHEACHWLDARVSQTGDLCAHEAAQFPGGPARGAILRHGDQGQRLSQVAPSPDAPRAMSYALVPLLETFWTRRFEVGFDALFSTNTSYRPAGERPAGPEGEGALILPRGLAVSASPAEPTTYGKSPFQWLERSNRQNFGQWLIDPAWELRQRYTIAESGWSEVYCDNALLGVSALQQPECAP